MTQVAQAVEVRPQSGWTGAEIHGVDLTTALSDAQVAEIRAALLKWKVVFFRDQFIGHDDHLRFARAFGAPTPAHPLFDAVPDPNYPAITRSSAIGSRRGMPPATDTTNRAGTQT
jgi:alpha-ketoglutarate-dependent taurine dioxygenase